MKQKDLQQKRKPLRNFCQKLFWEKLRNLKLAETGLGFPPEPPDFSIFLRISFVLSDFQAFFLPLKLKFLRKYFFFNFYNIFSQSLLFLKIDESICWQETFFTLSFLGKNKDGNAHFQGKIRNVGCMRSLTEKVGLKVVKAKCCIKDCSLIIWRRRRICDIKKLLGEIGGSPSEW